MVFYYEIVEGMANNSGHRRLCTAAVAGGKAAGHKQAAAAAVAAGAAAVDAVAEEKHCIAREGIARSVPMEEDTKEQKWSTTPPKQEDIGQVVAALAAAVD